MFELRPKNTAKFYIQRNLCYLLDEDTTKYFMHKQFTQTLCWDCNVNDLDSSQHARFIIERILLRGEMDDFGWAKKTYGDEKIKEIVSNNRTLDKKSQNFWCLYFHINPAKCTRNLSNKKQGLFWKK